MKSTISLFLGLLISFALHSQYVNLKLDSGQIVFEKVYSKYPNMNDLIVANQLSTFQIISDTAFTVKLHCKIPKYSKKWATSYNSRRLFGEVLVTKRGKNKYLVTISNMYFETKNKHFSTCSSLLTKNKRTELATIKSVVNLGTNIETHLDYLFSK